MRPSGPTESDQQVSESGWPVNGYHFTGYGVGSAAVAVRISAATARAGAMPAARALLPSFTKVRRSISARELIHSSFVVGRNLGRARNFRPAHPTPSGAV